MTALKRTQLIILFLVVFIISSGVLYAKKDKVINNDRSSYLLLEAQRLENLKHPDSLVAAFEMLNKVGETDITNQDALFHISSYYLAMNMPEKYYYGVLAASTIDTTNYYYNVKAADNALRVGDYNLAISIYKKLLRSNPNDESLYSLMADAYLEAGEIDSAMVCYDQLESMTEDTEFIALTKSEVYLHFKQYNKAISEIKRVLTQHPTNSTLLLALADTYISIDSLEQGKQYIDKAKEVGVDCFTSVFELEYYKKKKDVDNIYTTVENILECTDLDYEVKKNTIQQYVAALLEDGSSLETKSVMLENLSRTDSWFKILIDEYPRDLYVKELYAEVLQLQERFSEAVEQCQSALYINPSDIKLHRNMIRMLAYSNDYEAMNVAIENAANFADSTFVIESAAYYYSTKQLDKAIETLESATEKYKSSPLFLSEIYTTIADIYFNEGDKELPEKYYKLALEKTPENIMLLNNYAYYLAVSGKDLSLAEQISAKTIKAYPNNPVYLDTYAWIYFKQGRYLFAELYIKKAIENGGNEKAEILQHYGDILYHQNKIEEAVSYWKKVLEMYQEELSSEEVEILKQKIDTKTYIAK